jgi:hypothetical protein
MKQTEDKKSGSSEFGKPAHEIPKDADENYTLVIELGSPEPKKTKAEYKEGPFYKWTALATQIIIAVVTTAGIIIAVQYIEGP